MAISLTKLVIPQTIDISSPNAKADFSAAVSGNDGMSSFQIMFDKPLFLTENSAEYGVVDGKMQVLGYYSEDFYKSLFFDSTKPKMTIATLAKQKTDIWNDFTPNTAEETRYIDPLTPNGTYKIEFIRFVDLKGNEGYYTSTDLEKMGIKTSIEVVGGSSFAKNSDGSYIINGSATKDNMNGTYLNDSLNGAEGDDRITGGFGFDTLTGGKGADRFIYSNVKDAPVSRLGIETITDFSSKERDKIDLSKIDANDSLKGDQAFSKPVVGANFSGLFKKAGELFFDSTTSVLYGNVNADSAPDFAIKLNGVTTISASDIIL